jgi:hypothetical protein
MEIYTNLFLKNGFDDLNLLLDGMKEDITISDDNLREIGIYRPGHRARILLKLEEESKVLTYPLPGSVFHNCSGDPDKMTLDELIKDTYIKQIYNWLYHLKLEKYTVNFVRNGYHTLDLLYCQISSRYFEFI